MNLSDTSCASLISSPSSGTRRAVSMKIRGSVNRFFGSLSADGSVTTPSEWVTTRLPWTSLGTGMYQNQPCSNARLAIGDRLRSRKMFQSPGRDCAGRPPTMWFQIAMLR